MGQLSVVHKIACTSEERQKLEEKQDFAAVFPRVRFFHNCFRLVRTMNISFLECRVDRGLRCHGKITDA